jgi:hypothetical protein
LRAFLGVKIQKFFDARIRDGWKKIGFGINIPYPH